MSSPSSPKRESGHANESSGSQKRSSRACDQCRRTKSKCKPNANSKRPCAGCEASGTGCTYEGPSYKRGPPKGYIVAIEQRLRQVESVLGTIVGSPDPRARGLIAELKTDELANDIIHRVESGPFGPTGRLLDTGSSQEAFIAAMSPPAHAEAQSSRGREPRVLRENVSMTISQEPLASPTLQWQDKLLKLLESRQARNSPQELVTMPESQSSLETTPSVSLECEPTAAVGQLSVDENDQYRFHDESSGMPMLNRTSERSDDRNQGGIWRLPLSRFVDQQNEKPKDDIEESLETKLPPLPEQDFLLELYFTYVHPILPVVHKTSFMAAYQARCYALTRGQDDDAMDETTSDMPRCKEKISTLLLLSMFAIASRYNEPERDRACLRKGQVWEAGHDYFTSARQILDAVFRKSSMTVCQSVLLLAYREFGMGSLEQAWIYTGIAIRMAQSLGLHRNADKWRRLNVDVFSTIQKEERKLVWWSLFKIEKDISCALGRPVAITEGNYDTKLPEFIDGGTFALEEEEVWAPHPSVRPELPYKPTIGRTISCLRAGASLSIIIGRIVETLYSLCSEEKSRTQSSAYVELHKMLDEWYTDLPETLTLEHDGIATPHVFILHMQYWSTVILLRRKFIPLWGAVYTTELLTVRTDGLPMTALELCEGAASKVSMIATSMKESHSLAASCPFFASYLFTSGIVHVATLSLEPSAVRAEIGVAQVMNALQSMENVWQIASRNWELLNGARVRIGEAASSHDFRAREIERQFLNALEANQVDSTRWLAYILGFNLPQLGLVQADALSMATPTEALQSSATDVAMSSIGGGGSNLLSQDALDCYGTTLESHPDPSILSAFDGYDFQSLLHPGPFSN